MLLKDLLSESNEANRIKDFINQTYYVYNDGHGDRWVIEEAKAKYTIYFTMAGVSVEAHEDSGASPERAKQIEAEINSVV